MGWTVIRAWEHEPPLRIADRVDAVLVLARDQACFAAG